MSRFAEASGLVPVSTEKRNYQDQRIELGVNHVGATRSYRHITAVGREVFEVIPSRYQAWKYHV